MESGISQVLVTVIWIVAIATGVVLLGMVAYFLNYQLPVELSDVNSKTQPVDLAAFQNLRDPRDTAFLRERLRPAAFRRVQRLRTRAALEYLGRIANNSRVLIRAGEASRNSPDPKVAEAAESVIAEALRLRMLTLRVQLLLYLEWIDPGRSAATSGVCDRYESVRWRFGLLLSSQLPAERSRLLAAL